MTRTTVGRFRTAAAALAALTLAPSAGAAQAPLPEASQLIARYVEAIGGREAVMAQSASRSTGTFEMPAVGLRGEMEIVSAQPNLTTSVITFPGLGEIRNGFDGTVGWEVSPMTGARVLEGKELAALKDQSNVLATLRDPSLFRSMQTVERTEMGGQPCYRVKLVWVSGRESTDCFHVESGRLVASTATQESPMGSIPVTTLFSDFKSFGGVTMPTRMEMEMMGQKQVMTITSVETVSLDRSRFQPPAEIRALVGAGS